MDSTAGGETLGLPTAMRFDFGQTQGCQVLNRLLKEPINILVGCGNGCR